MEPEAKQIVEGIKKDVIEAVIPAVTEKTIAALEEKLANRKDVLGVDSEAKAKEETKKNAVEYVRKLANRQDTKGLTAGTATSGAELVPTYVSDQMIHVAEQVGLVRRYARPWPMQGSNVDVPTSTSVSAYRVDEGVKITSSKPTTGNVQLRGKTVGVIIPVSEKLLRNATINVVDALNMLAGEAIAKLEDQWGLLGLTAGEGIFQNTSVPGVTLGSSLTDYDDVSPEDLLDVIDKMDDNLVNDRTRWVFSLSFLNILRKIRAKISTDKQGFLFQGFGGSTPPTVWDLPYSLSTVMPKMTDESSHVAKKFVALANFDHMIHGDAKAYTMSISDQATITDTDGNTLINLFEQNMVALKVTGEIDIQLANPDKAFAWLKTSAS